MAFALSVFLSGMIVVGLFRLATRPQARRSLLLEFKTNPLVTLFVIVWCACWMMFFWGIFVPAFGQQPFMNTGLQVWQAGGLGSLVGWLLTMAIKRLNF